MKYQVYEEYKDSSIEWSDLLPKHWGSVSLRWLSKMYAGGTPSKIIEEYWEDGTVPWLNSGAVNQGLVKKASTYITKDAYENSSAKWIPKHALVMALAGQGKTKGMVAQLAIDSTCNQSMAAIVPNNLSDSRYLFWWLTFNYQNIRNMAGGDHRDGLNLELLGNIGCPIPTKDEKVFIANFLDHETAKIDTLIEKQQQLIKLLKEKRQAVISHAVTKGLNPNAPMCDSGVEWLDEVPEHWVKKVKLSNVAESNRGSFVNGPFGSDLLASELRNDGVSVVYIRDLNRTGYKRKSTVCVTTEKAKQLEVCKVKSGDILISKVGDPPGDTCVYPENEDDAIITQDVIRIRVERKVVTPFFLSMLLNSDFGQMVINDISVEGTRKRVSLGDFKATRFILPYLNEQNDIVTYVDNTCEKIDHLIARSLNAVDLIRERRTALISAAVTGKIDVRHPSSHTNTTKANHQAS